MSRSESTVSAEEWAVWRAFFAMRRQLDLALERQFKRDAGISAADYDVLISLFDASERQRRVGELGEVLGWEKSRVSHQVTRMAERGLVERIECDSDARGTWVRLTADGARSMLGAMRGHSEILRELFFDVVDADDLAVLDRISRSVLATIDSPGAARAAAEITR